MKKGQNPKYDKGYFQGYNKKDPSVYIKFPNEIENKNTARKSKTKHKNK